MTCMCMWLNHYSVAGWILSLCLVQMLRWCCLITTFKIPGRARSFKATTIFSMNPGKDSGCIWGVVIAWHFCMGLQSLKIFSCQERPAQGLLSLRAVSQEVLLTNFLKSWKLAFLKLRVNAVICTATAGFYSVVSKYYDDNFLFTSNSTISMPFSSPFLIFQWFKVTQQVHIPNPIHWIRRC